MPSRISIPSTRLSSDSPLGSVPSNVTTSLSRHGSGVGTPRAISMVSRVQQRDDELRRMFDLPQGELFMDEFYCALHKKILLQGRMYVFENYVCFYSNLFGWVKKKVIPLSEVLEISKKRNYGFPNSIRILWKSKKEFFTSFLSREDAYVLLVNARYQAQLSAQTLQSDPVHGNMMGSMLAEIPSGDIDSDEPPGGESPSSSQKTSDKPESSDSDKGHHLRNKAIGKLEKKKHDSLEAHDSDSEGYEDEDEWRIEECGIPPPSPSMECIFEEEFSTSVREFFCKILSNDSNFFEEFHKARGDQRYMESPWQKHSLVGGSVRHITFVSPVKSRVRVGLISPSKTDCTQNQRYCVYAGDHVVFEISQVMKDIPYGDYFRVETRWDVTPQENPLSGAEGCRLAIYAEVPFSRNVLPPIRRMIHTSVFREVRDSVDKMVALLREILAESSLSVTEESEGSLGEADLDLPDNLKELLNRKEFRQWIVHLVQEEFGAIPGDTLSLSSHRGRPRGSVDLDRLSNHGSRRKLWSSNERSWQSWLGSSVWSRSGRAPPYSGLLIIFVIVLFLFQIVSLLLWIFPWSARCNSIDLHSGSHVLDRAKVVSHLSTVHNDLQGFQQHLEALVDAVGVGVERITQVVSTLKDV